MSDYPFTVTIVDEVKDATMYYTTDGTDPDKDSDLYEEPFDVESPITQIRSFGTHPAYHDSDIAVYNLHPDPVPLPEGIGEWVAALTQRCTDYIYLYDLDLKAVIKIKIELEPKVVDILLLEPLYDLDYEKGYSGGQKGGYCINKSENRLWYLFRTGNNCEIIEVNISVTPMVLVKKTVLPSLLSGDIIMDGCADDDYTYWCTNLKAGRIVKIKNSDHSIDDNHLFSLTAFGCTTYEQGITQIDVLSSLGTLFWSYVLEGCAGSNACVVNVRSTTSFVIEIEDQSCGSGFGTPWNQNLLQIHDDYVFQHRAYWPSAGKMEKWTDTVDDTPDYTYSDNYSIDLQYLQNMLGKNGDYFFTLMRTNAVTPSYILHCLDFDTLSIIKQYTIPSAKRVSALNNDRLALVVYFLGDNYIEMYKADTSLDFEATTKMDELYRGR